MSKNVVLALLSDSQIDRAIVSDLCRQGVDFWFIPEAMNPRMLIRKALLDFGVMELHLFGSVDQVCFSMGGNVIFDHYFPMFESVQSRRSIFLWNIQPEREYTLDLKFVSAVKKRSRMSVFAGNYADYPVGFPLSKRGKVRPLCA